MTYSPPHCLITEQSLLAACLIGQVAPSVEPNDFSAQNHRDIARAMIDIERKGGVPDLVAVCEFLRKDIPASEIAGLMETVASDSNIEIYSSIVKSFSVARSIQARAAAFVSELNDIKTQDMDSLIGTFSAEILALADVGRKSREYTLRDTLRDVLADLDNRMHGGERIVGIPTGVYELDRLTCGMGKQELWVIGARPSMGKTALALNIIMHALKNGHGPVAFFSLDMSSQGIAHRMLAQEARVNLNAIRSGTMSSADYGKVNYAAQNIFDMPLTLTDDPATELDIVRKCRKIRPALVCVDFLTKIRPIKSSGSRYADYSNISGVMKNIAKELQCPLLLLVQLNRGNESENRAPVLSDMRETGAIEEDADVVLLIHADKNNRMSTTRTIYLAKHRQGEVSFWDMAWVGGFQRFERLERS